MNQESLAPATLIAKNLAIDLSQVNAAIHLLDEGATVPFIARYRKEATKGLDDTQLRTIAERLSYFRELNQRRESILTTIREQNRLTPELESTILAADSKARLEDLYLPYRPKRRTKAQLAREAGLEPLAITLLEDPTQQPMTIAANYLNAEAGFTTTEEVLAGAQQILMEHFSEEANLLSELREYFWQEASLESKGKKSKDISKNKFSDYLDYCEQIKKIPSHRALALLRGRREQILRLSLQSPDLTYGEKQTAVHFNVENKQRPADQWLEETIRLAWQSKIFPKIELDLLTRLRESADEEAISVFSKNLQDLLLAPPAGAQVTMGLDPGIRTGVKVAVVDGTGKLLDYTAVFPFPPQNDWHGAVAELAKIASKNDVKLISIGNGTGSRETERLVADLMKTYPDLKLQKVLVNEAGASIYSASALAAAEFPELDVTLRGAVSIARRLQDPLAELVKIEPKSIGVGQYQHDVNQVSLKRSLDAAVEYCVNAVGVDLNTASAALLQHISGLNETVAKNLIQYRDEHGAFSTREELKKVPRMGEKTYQQAVGFLRIINGTNPLDASSVHPETYPLVEKILKDQGASVKDAIGNRAILKQVQPTEYVDEEYGLPTIHDILKELEKPGRDPRPSFKLAQFKEGVETLQDLEVGMVLEGIVSNVTNFGAFVNIGVHQDGLVHISEMMHSFIKDPRGVVKVGEVVSVKVIEVDKERGRIGLSMKPEKTANSKPLQKKMPASAAKKSTGDKPSSLNASEAAQKKFKSKKLVDAKGHKNNKPSKPAKVGVFNTAMADALSALKNRSKK